MSTPAEQAAFFERVDRALDDVRPHLAIDGGNVELVEITDDNIVRVKWMGACVGCSMSQMTMRAGIEQTLRGKIPELAGVEAIN